MGICTAGQLHLGGKMWPVSTLIWVSSIFLPPPIHSSMINLVEGGGELVGVVGSFSWEFAWLLVSDFERQVAWVAGMLPASNYHQVSSPVSKDEATPEHDQPVTERGQSVRKEPSGVDNSIALEESSADKGLVYQGKDLVNHQGKVLVHHQFKGSVLVRFPDPPTSESGSAVHQGRKDLTRRGQELGHHHSKTPSYNKYGDEQSDHGHHPSKLRTLPMADNHPDNRDDNEDEVQPSEQSNDHMDDLQEENSRPGDRVKSRIQLWEAKVEGTNFAKEEDKRTNGKAGRQVNQVQPFSLRDGGQKHEFDHSQHDQDHRNHDQRNHQHHNHQKYGHSVDQMQVHETNHQNYQVHLNHNQVTRSNTSHNDNDHEETY